MSLIRTYEKNETEYQTLQLFATMVNRIALEEKVAIYMDIKDVYFDFGQDWLYTALITEDLRNGTTWQSLCPSDYELILKTDSITKLKSMAWTCVNLYKEGESIALYEVYK